MTTATEVEVRLRSSRKHPKQAAFIESRAKRKIVKVGRRGGKTTGLATLALVGFMAGRRVLYAAPTTEQLGRFWFEVKRALAELIDRGKVYVNETLHIIEFPGTEMRIRAKTAWNANTLRGDYADLLILDEWQLMAEETWEVVGAPMLLDNDGDAIFVYTPPSLASKGVTKAVDPRHASKMYKAAEEDTSSRWEAFHFTSHDNPYISSEALANITLDMSALAIRQEIGAEDVDEAPGALWTMAVIDASRVRTCPDLATIVIGVDPPGGAAECGIVAAGRGIDGDIYVFSDESLMASPGAWAGAVIDLHEEIDADVILGEKNFGGDMVRETIGAAARAQEVEITYRDVHASRGKAVRAQPIVAAWERGEIHMVGSLPHLEDEMVMWVPGSGPSPNRLDAMVWPCTDLRKRKPLPPPEVHDLLGRNERRDNNPLGLDENNPKYWDTDRI